MPTWNWEIKDILHLPIWMSSLLYLEIVQKKIHHMNFVNIRIENFWGICAYLELGLET